GAAKELKYRDDIAFLFVGGWSEFEKANAFARAHELTSIRCLPYQPQAQLSALLSSADLHVVVLGDAFSGIVHASKIYNILKIGTRFLFIGPEPSFVSKLITQCSEPTSTSVRHGDTQSIVAFISKSADRQQQADRRTSAHAQEFPALPGFSKFIGHVEAAA